MICAGSRSRLENIHYFLWILWLILGKKFWIRWERGEMSSMFEDHETWQVYVGFSEVSTGAFCCLWAVPLEWNMSKEMRKSVCVCVCVHVCACMCVCACECAHLFCVCFFLPIRELCKICPRFYLCLFLCFQRVLKSWIFQLVST